MKSLKSKAARSRGFATLFALLICMAAGPAHAACSSPAGNEADIVYNTTSHTYQFCNGTNWIQYGSGFAWFNQAHNNPTYPAGVGFFVLSKTTYTGNLGDLSGANASCLTDLTTNTGWKGYSTANGRGLLTGAKVFAFLCDNGSCNNLTASTVYYFANADNSSAGGASFTTDGSGLGPNDSADWAAANYFGGVYLYWTGSRTFSTDTAWSSNDLPGSTYYCSTNWNSSSSANSGDAGESTYNQTTRYGGAGGEAIPLIGCNANLRLICYVNP